MKQLFVMIAGAMIFIIAVGLMTQKIKKGEPLPFTPTTSPSKQTITVKDTKVSVEVAKTEEQRRLGLGKRASLGADDGMFFVFDDGQGNIRKNVNTGFWMKDMLISIDIIWIKDGKISKISKDAKVQPDTVDKDLIVYSPDVPIDFVLEVNSGFSDLHKFGVGDSVTIPNF